MTAFELGTAVTWRLLLLLTIGLICNGLFYRFRARKQAQHSPKSTSLWLRFCTLAILAPIVLLPLFLGPIPFTILILVLICVSLVEWTDWGRAFRQRDTSFRSGWQIGIMGAGYIFIPILFAMFLLIYQNPNGLGELVFFLLTIQLADVGAIYGGLFFGKRQMIPVLSPGKSWVGLIIGLLSAMVTGYWFRFTLPGTAVPVVLILAGLLALTGFMGDLWFSFFKRLASIKDFGRILPGHGGVLDRFDGYLLAVVTAWLLFKQQWAAAAIVILGYLLIILWMNNWLKVHAVVDAPKL